MEKNGKIQLAFKKLKCFCLEVSGGRKGRDGG
jgi:hypothetical protein